jgi:hypothetical protein
MAPAPPYGELAKIAGQQELAIDNAVDETKAMLKGLRHAAVTKESWAE